MRTIHVKASTEYDVLIQKGIMEKTGTYIAELGGVDKAVIVSDDNVFKLYGDIVKDSLAQANIETLQFVFEHGEDNKCISTFEDLLEFLCDNSVTRNGLIVALGGGVVGDLSGFAAATYQRGIRFIQVPTTLLACVDSSVGGKTAVNLKGGKNQAGCFYQPSLVLCDITSLDTLSDKELSNGMAEVIKYGMIGNKDLIQKLSKEDAKDHIEEIIETCIKMKRDIVEQDEYDKDMRMLLNFGHTMGHAIEKKSGFEIAHGEAVAIGMSLMTSASVNAGMCEEGVYGMLESLLKKYDLPTKTDFKITELLDAMKIDKKFSGDNINVIVPESLGKCIINKMRFEEFKEFISKA